MPGRFCAPRTSASSGAPSWMPRRCAAGRTITPRIGRPGRPPRPWTPKRTPGPVGGPPGRVITTLRAVLPDDAILTTDAGNFAGWAGRGFRFRRPGTFLGPTSGAMGYAIPAAIAAALVHRDRPVVALVGDGGMAMTMAELETCAGEDRIVVLVFDNERYGTIRMWQSRRGAARASARSSAPSTSLRSRAARGHAACASSAMRTSNWRCARPGRGTLDRDPARPRPGVGVGRRACDRLTRASRSQPQGGRLGSAASAARICAPIASSEARCLVTKAASNGAAASARARS